ncbi:MAG: 4-alpha-glucanotransferase [Catenibacillus sp.]
MKTAVAKRKKAAAIQKRFSGILVHPTSFPSPYGIGDLGSGAYEFIDFLKAAGQSIWQCLPLGPTGYGDSPYQSFSSFAGQPLLISPDKLMDMGLLSCEDLGEIPQWDEHKVDYGSAIIYKTGLLKKAYTNFLNQKTAWEIHHTETKTDIETIVSEFSAFCRKQRAWLDDYALFMTLKDLNNGNAWIQWPQEYRFLTPKMRRTLLKDMETEIGYYRFIQYLFYQQWNQVHTYAHENGIRIVGDIPIFVSPDSADVWANKQLFQLDSKGYPLAVAGVPPDYFSATGQLWGNPLYDWAAHKAENYHWWIERIKSQLKLVDFLRIDHFRGFEAYWSVPYGRKNAVRGRWVKGPGADLFNAVAKALGDQLPIFAEDLGIITPQVEKLRDTFNFPGMKVLQFAFDNVEENNFLPYMYPENCICYTGTHDNDTTRGWYEQASEASRDKVRRYMNCDGSIVARDFIRTALGSVARFAIFPLQDVLGLGSEARMNMPGNAQGNWTWRFTKDVLTDGLAKDLAELCILYGREPKS